EVVGELVDVVGEVRPGSGHTRHLRLAAKLALGADLAGDAGHFGGEAVELIDHRVDGVLELENLTLHVDGDLLGKVALGDGGGHFGDITDLAGQVVGHQIDVVGEVLPRAGDAFDTGLAAELALGADLARHAGHFGGETVQLIDHRVDGVFEFEDFALHLDRDLLGQVAASNGSGHFGDIAHLTGEVGRHRVDVVGQVLPGSGNTFDLRLAAELAFGADFAGHARHLRSEGAELLDHRIHDLADPQELAPQRPAVDLDDHGLGEIALGDRADHPRHLGGRLDHVVNELVNRAKLAVPAATRTADAGALRDLAFLANDPRKALEFLGDRVVHADDFIE